MVTPVDSPVQSAEYPVEGPVRRHPRFDPLRRLPDRPRQRLRRGVYLIPSLFTLGNMFCGYLCVLFAIGGELEVAALFIGLAFLLDGLDGRIARMTGTETPFGLEFDSLADVISFGVAPAVLTFMWGLQPLGRLGWAAGFIYVTAAAMRLARFNIQTGANVDKRYYVGMPSPAAAAIPASTVYFYPEVLHDPRLALIALGVMVLPAFLMVSTLRFRGFKTFDLRVRRSYKVLALLAMAFAVIQLRPPFVLIVVAYAYLLSAFVEWIWSRLKRRPPISPPA
jgi:CDP-diacylglycerol--serine O-phosphatidyltransferase